MYYRNSILTALLALFVLPANAQILIAKEDFSGGTANWVDLGRNPVSQVILGGHDGGPYISVTTDVDTNDSLQFTNSGQGAAVTFRCSESLENCSNGIFSGDWWLTRGVQELSFWFRHNSSRPGGVRPAVRFAVPRNSLGVTGILPAVPANIWTKVTLVIDPRNPAIDQQFGSLVPDFVRVAKRVDRLQPSIYIDPDDWPYVEANVTFDLDDVELRGATVIPAVVNLKLPPAAKKNKLHPRHAGPPAINDLDDPIPMIVYGSSTNAGDAVDLNTDDIITGTVRIGPIGGVQNSVGPTFNLDDDNDGLEDAKFATRTLTSGFGGGFCDFNTFPTEIAVRAELTTGEIVAGSDFSIDYDCDAGCHNTEDY